MIRALLEQTELREHSVLVVGCSSSEILGGHIGKIGSMEVADAVYQGIAPVLQEKGIHAQVDFWGLDVNHDWDWWFRQCDYYVPQFIG